MIMQIGIVAGDIWHHLEKNGQATLTELCQSIDKSRGLILMGLGWLAREGHIILESKESDYRCYLRK